MWGCRDTRLHAFEATVDVLLARAQELSAGVDTHAHRYVPSRWGPEAPLILPEVVMTAGRKKNLRSL